jgi:hypothetical protein
VRAALHRRLVRLIAGEVGDAHGQLFFSQFGEDAFLQRYSAKPMSATLHSCGRASTWTSVPTLRSSFPTRIGSTNRAGAESPSIRPREPQPSLIASGRATRTWSWPSRTLQEHGSPHVINTLSKAEADEWAQRMKQTPVEIVVHAVRLEQVLEEHLPAGQQIHFLSIDAEEWDYRVLKSNDWNRFRPDPFQRARACTARRSSGTRTALFRQAAEVVGFEASQSTSASSVRQTLAGR